MQVFISYSWIVFIEQKQANNTDGTFLRKTNFYFATFMEYSINVNKSQEKVYT